ncbi:MAG: hypothetical protein WKF43_08505 [Acidimicrobiales bacterium]
MATVLSHAGAARAGGDGESAGGPAEQPSGLDHLGDAALAVVLCAVAGFAFVAVPLAVVGSFRPLLVVPAVAGATVGLVELWDPRRSTRDPHTTVATGWGWIAAAVVAVLSLALSIGSIDQHVLQDRDPGHYVNAALWLAADGSSSCRPRSAPSPTRKPSRPGCGGPTSRPTALPPSSPSTCCR